VTRLSDNKRSRLLSTGFFADINPGKRPPMRCSYFGDALDGNLQPLPVARPATSRLVFKPWPKAAGSFLRVLSEGFVDPTMVEVSRIESLFCFGRPWGRLAPVGHVQTKSSVLQDYIPK
jgi:hypothetical protein